VTAFVFALPYTPPPPPAPKWDGYKMTWKGADGTVWALDGSQGVVLLHDGLVGLHTPGYDRYTSSSAARPGVRHRGSRAKERSVEWNLLVYSDESSAGWREIDRAFWSSFDPDIPGVWTVSDVTGRTLSLECRFVGPDSDPYDTDPSRRGWSIYSVQMVATEPFWTAAPVEASWQNEPPEPFFGTDGQLHIVNGSSTTDAVMTNPGDEPAWLQWEIEGPMFAFAATVDGGQIQIPALDTGDRLVIDTDPSEATAILNDIEDVSGAVDPWDPRPVPPGRDVPLHIVATGFGKVTARLTPKYRRGV
jgi:hypothetical protein